jgi:isoprenylcysteine carboxyl methyltransferase (ICMT) family protein YpbQ
MDGAVKYGHGSTVAVWVATAAIYVGSAIEGFSFLHTQFDRVAVVGLAIYIFSALALLWVMRCERHDKRSPEPFQDPRGGASAEEKAH